MNGKTFAKYLDRDGGCVHCGEVTAAVPHHRANRGMGGSKVRDVPSNIVVMCSTFNGLMESDSVAAAYAARHGWKLNSWQDPKQVAFFHAVRDQWFLIDDEFNSIAAP